MPDDDCTIQSKLSHTEPGCIGDATEKIAEEYELESNYEGGIQSYRRQIGTGYGTLQLFNRFERLLHQTARHA